MAVFSSRKACAITQIQPATNPGRNKGNNTRRSVMNQDEQIIEASSISGCTWAIDADMIRITIGMYLIIYANKIIQSVP